MKIKISINKTWILVTVLIFFTISLLALSFKAKTPVPKPTVKQKVVEKNIPSTFLGISDEIRISTRSGIYEVDVNIDSGENQLNSVELQLSYDSKALVRVDLRPGNFFKDPVQILNKINEKEGIISYAVQNTSESFPKTKGVIAIITFSKIKTGPTYIDFLPQTLATSKGSYESLIKNMSPGIIDILPTPTKRNQPTFPSPSSDL